MKSPKVQAFYSQKARFYQRFFVGFLQWENVLAAFFKSNDYLYSNIKILDAGCGSGPVTKVLYRLAREQGISNILFHGFDLTPAMLDLFRQWIQEARAEGIQVQQADVLSLESQLPPDWKDYDLVVSSTMLEYIPVEKRPQALANLRGVMRENSRLLLFVTRRTWITRWTGQKWWGTHLFDRDTLAVELRQAGFSTIHFKTLPGSWNSFLLAVEAQFGDQDTMDEVHHPPVGRKEITRYLDQNRLSLGERLLEAWFAPKRFESPALYQRMGVLLLKRYVPTGGDFFIQRFGVRIVDIRGSLESMIHLEQMTRIYEVIHTFAFLGFTIFSFRRWRKQQTTFPSFLFAVLVYILLILSPIMLQRYNRIRAYHAIQLLARKEKIRSGSS